MTSQEMFLQDLLRHHHHHHHHHHHYHHQQGNPGERPAAIHGSLALSLSLCLAEYVRATGFTMTAIHNLSYLYTHAHTFFCRNKADLWKLTYIQTCRHACIHSHTHTHLLPHTWRFFRSACEAVQHASETSVLAGFPDKRSSPATFFRKVHNGFCTLQVRLKSKQWRPCSIVRKINYQSDLTQSSTPEQQRSSVSHDTYDNFSLETIDFDRTSAVEESSQSSPVATTLKPVSL